VSVYFIVGHSVSQCVLQCSVDVVFTMCHRAFHAVLFIVCRSVFYSEVFLVCHTVFHTVPQSVTACSIVQCSQYVTQRGVFHTVFIECPSFFLYAGLTGPHDALHSVVFIF